jgi:hypothetical protein
MDLITLVSLKLPSLAPNIVFIDDLLASITPISIYCKTSGAYDNSSYLLSAYGEVSEP